MTALAVFHALIGYDDDRERPPLGEGRSLSGNRERLGKEKEGA